MDKIRLSERTSYYVREAAASIFRAMDMDMHMITCKGCDFCAGERLRRLERQFAQAGEDDYCYECGHNFAPWNITDEVEDVIL